MYNDVHLFPAIILPLKTSATVVYAVEVKNLAWLAGVAVQLGAECTRALPKLALLQTTTLSKSW